MNHFTFLLLASSVASTIACGSGDRPPPLASKASTGGQASATGGAAGHATGGSSPIEPSVGGAPGAGGSAADGGAAGSGGGAASTGGSTSGTGGGSAGTGGGDAPPVHIFDDVDIVPASNCENARAVPSKILDEGSETPLYDVLGNVNDRFYAYSRSSQVLVTFDVAGKAVSTSILGVAAAAATGDRLRALVNVEQELVLQEYDENLNPIDDSTPVTSGLHSAFALAAHSDATLVTWVSGGLLHGQIHARERISVFELPDATPESRCRTRVLPADQGFVLTLTCSGATTPVRFAHVDRAGMVSQSTVITTASGPVELVDVRPTTGGYVGLFQQLTSRTAFMLHWDGAGALASQPRGFSDVLQTYGLAPSGGGFGLALQLADERSSVAPLSAEGAPVYRAWTCLDAALPGGQVAVAGTSTEMLALVRYGNGSAWALQLPAP